MMNMNCTLEEIERISVRNQVAVFPVTGDCMEGAGIDKGDYIAVSFRHFPRPQSEGAHDACLCWVKGSEGRPFLGVKEYLGVWGKMQSVETRNKEDPEKPFRMDAGFIAERIFGVVYACYDSNHHLKWGKDLKQYPEHMGTSSTIFGTNCGCPEKKSAPTAATVQSANVTSHIQFTSDLGKIQGTKKEKYPLDGKTLPQAYIEGTGDTCPDGVVKELFFIMVGMVNKAYEDGKRDALAEVVS